ncbi:MAG: adenylyltransferase/cytidyltransferase family protein [Patescibacteria group bacterium]
MGKIATLEEVLKATQKARKQGKKIVATNGCFDILHVGHVRNLQAAKKLGDILIVGVNSDASVRQNKGSLRPIVPARERAEVIAALEAVDYAFIFSGKTPLGWIAKIKPDFHVKGGGADVKAHPDFPKHEEVVRKEGGKLILLKHHHGRSTSTIIEKIVEAEKRKKT